MATLLSSFSLSSFHVLSNSRGDEGSCQPSTSYPVGTACSHNHESNRFPKKLTSDCHKQRWPSTTRSPLPQERLLDVGGENSNSPPSLQSRHLAHKSSLLCSPAVSFSTADQEEILASVVEDKGVDLQKNHKAQQLQSQSHLPEGLTPELMPRHVAIIMDGNSRWATGNGLPTSAGHEAGVAAFKEVVRLSGQWGVQELTVFAFSAENWGRPKMEVRYLMQLFERVLRHELVELQREKVRIRFIGNLSTLPASLQRLMDDVHHRTAKNAGLRLSVAISYSGRQEIAGAAQRLAAKVAQGLIKAEDVTEEALANEIKLAYRNQHLWEPDLLIRTSGEQRLSNFQLWQLAYTELYFSAVHWPDFGEAEYARAIAAFQRRERRFGAREPLVPAFPAGGRQGGKKGF